MLNFNHLYYFHVAATTGSFAKAAEQLGISHPTISEQVRLLERRMHVPLFTRTTSGVRLTETGRNVYHHTTIMFRAGERIAELLGQAEGTSTVRVGISLATSRSVSHGVVARLLQSSGRMVQVRMGAFGDLYRDLRDRMLDLVLCETEPADAAGAGLEVARLGRRPQLVGIVAEPIVLTDAWHDLPFIQYGPSSPYREEVEDFLLAERFFPRCIAEMDDPELMVDAAVRALAIVFVPAKFAHDALASGLVRRIAVIEPRRSDVIAVFDAGAGREMAHALAVDGTAAFAAP